MAQKRNEPRYMCAELVNILIRHEDQNVERPSPIWRIFPLPAHASLLPVETGLAQMDAPQESGPD
jgi:hypothetical protein